jgi:HK97 family phage major capsid protein
MADSAALVEKREAFAAKQKALGEVLELAGNDLDFSRKPVLEKLGATDAADATSKFKSWTKEAEALGLELDRAEIKYAAERNRERQVEMDRPSDVVLHAVGSEKKGWSQRFVESAEFKAAIKSKGRQSVPFEMDVDIKTLMTTAAGFAPESVRSGLLVEKAERPIDVLDLIPTFPIAQAAFVYMEETTRTHSAAETAEGAAYAEDAFAWTQRTSTVRKIASQIPVTDEQLEDEMQVRSILEQRLAFGLRQKLDSQILVGDGSAPNLRGINNVASIQTQAKGSDPTIVAFMKALTKIRFTGRANPTGAVFHPNDWQDIVLTQNANGDYLFGNPFMGPGPSSLLGIPVALSTAQTENTGLVVDFRTFTRLDDRRGVSLMLGYIGDQFKEGEQTLRADMRVAFTVTRAAAVCQITGI